MQQVIYTKFSNERDEQFCIRTQVYEDEEGRRSVRKYASNIKANEHIKKIYDRYKQLKDLYKDTNLEINVCELHEKYAEFEYIEGKTLEQQLDELLFSGQYHKFQKLIDEYVELLKSGTWYEKFIVTSEFKDIFGIDKIEDGNSLLYTDIDMIFSNIIIRNGTWILIDYEWTYNFPIPFNYVLYRARVNYFVANPRRKELCKKHGLLDFDISEEKKKIYQKMDDNFIQYVSGGKISVEQFYRDTEDKILTRDILREIGTQRNVQRYQMYYDLGDDFSEENSRYGYQIATHKIHHIDIAIENKCKKIRFDPSDYKGLLYINKICINDKQVKYITNGISIGEKVVAFLEDDPWIIIDNENTDKILAVEYQYTELDEKELQCIIEIWKNERQIQQEQRQHLEQRRAEFERQTVEKNELQIKFEKEISENTILKERLADITIKKQNSILENEELKKQIEEQQKIVNSMTNSMSWRITKPLRKLREIVRGR